MIWQYKDCPMCGCDLKIIQGDPNDPLYLMRCPTKQDLPQMYFTLSQGGLILNELMSHFEIEVQNHKPVYQVVRVYPYSVKSYNDVSNIYMYDFKLNSRFVAETPYLDLPWNNKEKIIQKLSLYTLFS